MKRYLTMRYPTAWSGEMWREAAPCGNGTVGLAVYGSVHKEIISVNHAQLWRGGGADPVPDVSDALTEVRGHLDNERPDLADGVLQSALRGAGYRASNALPLPLGDILITRVSHQIPRRYRRIVDMEQAEVSVMWQEEDGTMYRRDTFASRADGLCYTCLSADRPGSISVTVTAAEHDRETLGGTQLSDIERRVSGDCVLYAAANPDTAYVPARGDYGIVLRVLPVGGVMTASGSDIRIESADEVLLAWYVFVGKDRVEAFTAGMDRLSVLPSYDEALAAHAALHRAFFDTVNFSISGEEDRSNEELLLDAYEAECSNELIEKMYAYGRYLFICATGDGGELPVHLVGLWNGTYQGFWAIHMYNVNFEMIHWNALSGNLFPLMKNALLYVESFMDDYRENARKIFGCRGIYVDSVNTPETARAACLANHILNWTGGAGWLSQHFYDYYRYTGDEDFLREHALPFMAEAALFYEDFLREGKDGYLEFAPSTSPENVSGTSYRLLHVDNTVQCSKNATMDVSIACELLSNLLEASVKTGLYADRRDTWQTMLDRLPPYKFNPDGSLKEWADDFYDDNLEHRHSSHMFAVFPGHTVTKESPLFDSFVKALDNRRKIFLTEQTSWAMISLSGVYARMQRADMAFTTLSEAVRNCCLNNLFTVHNDWRRMGSTMGDDFRLAPFQIDANIGFPAVVNEMLLNSSDGRLIVFPALPAQWKTGYIKGLCAVGGYVLDMEWDETEASVTIRGGWGGAPLVCGPGWRLTDGGTKKICPETGVIRLTRT